MSDTIDVSSLQTFTDAQQLVVVDYAIMMCSMRKNYQIAGRTYTSESIAELRKLRAEIITRIQDDANMASGLAGNTSVVTFDDPN